MHAALIRRIRVRVQQTYDHDLDTFSLQTLAGSANFIRRRDDHDVASRINSLVDLNPKVSLHKRPILATESEKRRPISPAEIEHVAKATRTN